MPLTDRQAFACGFLLKCAEAGLDGREVDALISRAEAYAAGGEKRGGVLDALKALGAVGTLGATNVAKGGLIGLAAAGGVGALGGVALGHIRSGPPPDPEDVQKQELIAAYNSVGDQVRTRKVLEAEPRPGPARRP